jgi:signal peptidase
VLITVIAVAGSLLLAQAAGYKPLAILSGSMEPAYNVYGLVVVDTNVVPEDIAEGDVISFMSGEDTTVTHRVIGIDKSSRIFSTKGDANNTEDFAPVPFDNLVGRATLHVPWLGYILTNMKTQQGIGMGAIMLALLVALFAIPAILAPGKQEGQETQGKQGDPPEVQPTGYVGRPRPTGPTLSNSHRGARDVAPIGRYQQ